jgi:hypothetical protein
MRLRTMSVIPLRRTSMADVQMVKNDAGGVNARILAREEQADFRRVETASIKMHTRFMSAEGKRLFVRMFNTLQLNAHFISVIARTRLDHDDVAKNESAIRDQIDAASASLNAAFDGAEALFKANGISGAATYDTVPLEVDVPVLSSLGRRYLEVLVKLDQFMPLLQTLEIHEILSAEAVDVHRAALKREVRNVANTARNLAAGVRRRMNAMGRDAGEPEPESDMEPDAVELSEPSAGDPQAEGDGPSEPHDGPHDPVAVPSATP